MPRVVLDSDDDEDADIHPSLPTAAAAVPDPSAIPSAASESTSNAQSTGSTGTNRRLDQRTPRLTSLV